jgi:site-specific recombinase XerD
MPHRLLHEIAQDAGTNRENDFIGKPIRLAYLGDLQRYADALAGSPASCARRLLVVKSLLSFASRMGFTPFNIGAAIRPPRPDDRLAERILDHALIRFL